MNARSRLAAGAAALTVFAALSAFGVNRGVASLLSVDPSALVEVEAPARGASLARSESPQRGLSVRSQMEYRTTILGRNIFDHTAIAVPVENEVVDGDGSVTKTSLPLVLVATMVAEPVEFSSALIKEEGNDAFPFGYGIGDKIKDAEVIEIHQKKVILKRSDGSLEALLAGGEELEEDVGSSSGDDEGASEFDGINQTGENSFEVDRSLLEKYMGDPSLLAGLGAARPHRSDGEVDGYRLYRIRRDSIGSALGLKNGDVVHSVNGRPLSNMSEAMQAFQELQSSGSFQFEVTRRGQKQTMDYSVR